MEIVVLETHRTLEPAFAEKMNAFFCEVKDLNREQAGDQVRFCDWYEKEYAVKWFEVMALEEEDLVGYMRVFRNPEKIEEWYFGDVHVVSRARKRGVATAMYEKAMGLVKEYEAAEHVIAAVNRKNVKSIGLHTKMGFEDTGRNLPFACFEQVQEETTYVCFLYQTYPVRNVEMAFDNMLEIWKEYVAEKRPDLKQPEEELKKRLEKAVIGKDEGTGEKAVVGGNVSTGEKQTIGEKPYFAAVWCGNRLVGFEYRDDEEEVSYIRQQTC